MLRSPDARGCGNERCANGINDCKDVLTDPGQLTRDVITRGCDTVPIVARECEKTPVRLQGALTRSVLTHERFWPETSLFFYSHVMLAMASLEDDSKNPRLASIPGNGHRCWYHAGF